MLKGTKESMQIYVPLILGISLNGVTGVMAMSGYMEGFLQGMAVVLLCLSVIQMIIIFKRRMKTTSK